MKLIQKLAKFFSDSFDKTPGGKENALETLSRISPKYTKLLEKAMNKYDEDNNNGIISKSEET